MCWIFELLDVDISAFQRKLVLWNTELLKGFNDNTLRTFRKRKWCEPPRACQSRVCWPIVVVSSPDVHVEPIFSTEQSTTKPDQGPWFGADLPTDPLAVEQEQSIDINFKSHKDFGHTRKHRNRNRPPQAFEHLNTVRHVPVLLHLCETGFSEVAVIKTKHRSKEMRIAVSKTQRGCRQFLQTRVNELSVRC